MNGAFFAVALSCMILAAPVWAQEKFGDKRVYQTVKSEAFPIADADGHILAVSEVRGYDLQQGNTILNRVVTDVIKGNGKTFGYGTSTNPDGDLAYYSFEGKVSTRPGSDGKPVTTAEGTWVLTGGTGKWKDRDGRGVFKSRAVNAGGSVAEWEGTWQPKK